LALLSGAHGTVVFRAMRAVLWLRDSADQQISGSA
jgi:hypothetical protein